MQYEKRAQHYTYFVLCKAVPTQSIKNASCCKQGWIAWGMVISISGLPTGINLKLNTALFKSYTFVSFFMHSCMCHFVDTSEASAKSPSYGHPSWSSSARNSLSWQTPECQAAHHIGRSPVHCMSWSSFLHSTSAQQHLDTWQKY